MAAGDTAPVRMLAGTIEMLGRGSGYGRDRRMHHYSRGLLRAHHGDRDGAVAAFRDAAVANNFARPRLELARLLIELGRPEEATVVLQAALRGPIASGGFYVTRPELQELLGRAWDAAGRPDSAVVYYQNAIAAWERADPEVRQRSDAMRRRVAALSR